MEELSTVWTLVGMVTTVLIVGAMWGDIRRQVHTLTKQWNQDRKETREVLKALQEITVEHEGDIKVLLDRIER